MRILLTSNASYAPPRGGSTRSNLLWLAHLARAGHSCRVVCPPLDGETSSSADTAGISILRIKDLAWHRGRLADEIHSFQPDWVLVSSEDLSHVLLRAAHQAAPGRLVYLAHTPQFFPFGPASWNPHAEAAKIVRQAAAVVAIGHHMAGYIGEHCGVEAAVIHPPIYGEPPFPPYASFGRGLILMINPCRVKGIGIFLDLADRFPNYPFGALLGWGTTSADRLELQRRPNIQVLQSVPQIDDVLSQTRLLLMPSLWYEGFGLIAMEAMLRGIPVISSDSGGLLEAKKGTSYIVPVTQIERFTSRFDENHMPEPAIAPQDLGPWSAALATLLENEIEYQAESERSRQAARVFVSALDAAALERLLLTLTPGQAGSAAPEQPRPVTSKQLSPAKRALLLQRLRERGQA